MPRDVQSEVQLELDSFVCANFRRSFGPAAHSYVSCEGTSFCGRHKGTMHGDSISIPVGFQRRGVNETFFTVR